MRMVERSIRSRNSSKFRLLDGFSGPSDQQWWKRCAHATERVGDKAVIYLVFHTFSCVPLYSALCCPKLPPLLIKPAMMLCVECRKVTHSLPVIVSLCVFASPTKQIEQSHFSRAIQTKRLSITSFPPAR